MLLYLNVTSSRQSIVDREINADKTGPRPRLWTICRLHVLQGSFVIGNATRGSVLLVDVMRCVRPTQPIECKHRLAMLPRASSLPYYHVSIYSTFPCDDDSASKSTRIFAI